MASSAVPKEEGQKPAWMEVFANFGQIYLESRRPRDAFLEESAKDVVSRTLSGELVGLGFERERNLEDIPVLLPSEVWKWQVFWSHGEVHAEGLKFVEVRLLFASELNAAMRCPSKETKKQGRPSVKPFVNQAIQALHQEGRIRLAESQASHYDAIRILAKQIASQSQTEIPNLSDETIRKYFGPMFQQLKDAKKQ